MQGWTNANTAWSIYTDSNSSLAEKYAAANFIGLWVGAHGSLVVGLAGLSCAASGPACVAVVEGALGIGAATSADGDPINEIVVLGKFPNYLNVAKDIQAKVFDIPA